MPKIGMRVKFKRDMMRIDRPKLKNTNHCLLIEPKNEDRVEAMGKRKTPLTAIL